MKILYFIQKWRKEKLIKKLINIEISLSRNELWKYENLKIDDLACSKLSGELFARSVPMPNGNSLWSMFMYQLLFPFGFGGGLNVDGKSFLEDVLKKTKEEVEKDINKDVK